MRRRAGAWAYAGPPVRDGIALDAWRRHDAILRELLTAVPRGGLAAGPAGSRGRDVARPVFHPHRVPPLARALAGLSLNQIGARCGGRDHSTVLHACQKIQKMLHADEKFRAEIDALADELTA